MRRCTFCSHPIAVGLLRGRKPQEGLEALPRLARLLGGEVVSILSSSGSSSGAIRSVRSAVLVVVTWHLALSCWLCWRAPCVCPQDSWKVGKSVLEPEGVRERGEIGRESVKRVGWMAQTERVAQERG